MSYFPGLAACLILCVSVAPGGGCNPARESARRVIDELNKAVEDREAAFEGVVRELCRAHLATVHSHLDSAWAEKLAGFKTEVYEKTLRKQSDLRRQLVQQLEDKIRPVLDRLDQDLKDEKEKVKTGTAAGRERELLLAAQLSATLAVTGRETQKIELLIDEELVKVRDDLLAEVSRARRPEVPDLESQADALVQEWKKNQSDEYLKAMDIALNELRRYVEADSAPILVLKGLLGDKLGATLGNLLQSKSEALVNAAGNAFEEWATGQRRRLEQELSEKEKNMLRSGPTTASTR
jgi:hypothetical protein